MQHCLRERAKREAENRTQSLVIMNTISLLDLMRVVPMKLYRFRYQLSLMPIPDIDDTDRLLGWLVGCVRAR